MKLSIIIPVYNAEKYLEECISSVISQSFGDFELLLINDGSTDNSDEICLKFALQDHRVKVFNQTNKGVSSARNIGLFHAKGEWVTFIDSDDYISEDYFSDFVKKESEKFDWLFMDIKRITSAKNPHHLHFDEFRLERKDFIKRFTLYPHFPGPCAKFYKLSIIRDNQIEFDKRLSFGEDALFNLQYLFKCSSMAGLKHGNYFYRAVEGGLSTKIATTKKDQYLYDEILRVLREENVDDDTISSYIKFPLERLFFTTLETEKNYRKKRELFKKMIEDCREELIEFTRNKTPYMSLLCLLVKFRQLNLLIVSSYFRRIIRA